MSDLILGEDRWASEASDPIELLREGARRILESTGNNRPSCIIIARATVLAMADWAGRAIRRAEKFLRKALLSGQYQKRRRQKNSGRTARRLAKRRELLRELPMWRDQLVHWSRLAGIDSSSLTLDMEPKERSHAE